LEDDKMSTLYSMVLISIICVFIGMWIWCGKILFGIR